MALRCPSGLVLEGQFFMWQYAFGGEKNIGGRERESDSVERANRPARSEVQLNWITAWRGRGILFRWRQ